jgi:hypothetical protein
MLRFLALLFIPLAALMRGTDFSLALRRLMRPPRFQFRADRRRAALSLQADAAIICSKQVGQGAWIYPRITQEI